MGYRACEEESWQLWNKHLISMEEKRLKVQCAAVTCFLNCWLSWSVNFQHFSACALILDLQLRTLPLELGSAEQVPALPLWAHNSLVAHRCLLASATDVFLAAAFAVAVFTPAPLAEDVFLISHAALFFFVSQTYVGQSMAYPFGSSVQ